MSDILEKIKKLKSKIDEQIDEVKSKLDETCKKHIETDYETEKEVKEQDDKDTDKEDKLSDEMNEQDDVEDSDVGKDSNDDSEDDGIDEGLTSKAKKRLEFINKVGVDNFDKIVLASRRLKEFSSFSKNTAIKLLAKKTGVDEKMLAEYISLKHLWESIHVESVNDEDKEEYEKYFQSMLDKYNVKSPDELDDEKRKKFFDEVDAGWDAEKESD